MEKQASTVGWREWVRLPELGIRRIKAKIDTGARSCSLHAFDIEEFERDGVKFVRFKVHPVQRSEKKVKQLEAKVVEYREVRSSSGHKAMRPVIETEVEICGLRQRIELTLADRNKMGFRMLIGRRALKGRFLVDSAKSYYGGKPKKKKKKKKTAEQESLTDSRPAEDTSTPKNLESQVTTSRDQL